MTADILFRWKLLGFISTLLIVVSVPAWLIRQGQQTANGKIAKEEVTFVGRDVCRSCHEKEYKEWSGSDHDRSMEVANETTVLGDFNNVSFTFNGISSRFFRKGDRFMVNTEGPDGKMSDFEVLYTFGYRPLQQYLIAFPNGRLQCLSIAWDNDKGTWYHLYQKQKIPADDWLHWTKGGQNWNGMCAECHSTNLKKNYDSKTKSFNTTWFEIDVSCEACHGPGSRHVEWAKIQAMARPKIDNVGLVVKTSDMEATEEINLCAPCHSRRSELGDYDHTQKALLDYSLPALLTEALYHSDGQILDEVYVWGSFTQSKMFSKNVRCSDCHNVHGLQHLEKGNKLCTRCHLADVYDTKEHHFHKKVHEGKPSDGALCIKCHMPETPYMVIDERADHSIRIPRPDLTASIETPNACSQKACHADKELDWVLEAFTKWYGQAKKPHYAGIIDAGRKGKKEAERG